MDRLSQIAFAIMILLNVTVFAGENDIRELITKLDQISVESRQVLLDKYSSRSEEFREHYLLTADIRLFNLRIGRLALGDVIISDRDSFSISYDPPFEKWDTRYLSYWANDSIFVDEVLGQAAEKIIYRRDKARWTFSAYESDNPRELKQQIFRKGFATSAVNLIEFTRLLFHRKLADIREVLFLAETYPISLKKMPDESTNFTVYNLKWKLSKGEERVRLHGVHLVGIETETHFIPVGGILKVSFVGLLDIDLIGIID